MRIEKQRGEDYPEVGHDNEGHYPYGTRLEIEDDMVMGLGLDDAKAGDQVMLRGVAFIATINETETPGEEKKCMTLQLTDLEVSPVLPDRAEDLYG